MILNKEFKIDSTIITFIAITSFWLYFYTFDSHDYLMLGVPYNLINIKPNEFILNLHSAIMMLFVIIIVPVFLLTKFGPLKPINVIIPMVLFIFFMPYVISPNSDYFYYSKNRNSEVLILGAFLNTAAVAAHLYFRFLKVKVVQKLLIIVIVSVLCFSLFINVLSIPLSFINQFYYDFSNKSSFVDLNGELHLFIGESNNGVILTRAYFMSRNESLYCTVKYGDYFVLNKESLHFITKKIDYIYVLK